MGNAASIFDCAVNPLAPMPEDGDEMDEGPLTLEDRVPLRDSLLWKLQRQYYDQMGIRAWSEGIVPNFVSCNAFVARAYARSLLGFLRDVHAAEQAAGVLPTHPVHIIEVGSGHGKLAYLVVEALLRFRAFLPPSVPGLPPFVYVVTDPVPSVLASIRAHPALVDWFAQGLLDTAVWEAEGPAEMHLQGSGTTLLPGSLSRPTAVLASYVLDSLRSDAVRVTKTGGVEQARVSLLTPRKVDTKEALSHDMLGRVAVLWGYRSVPLDSSPEGLFSGPPYAGSTVGAVLAGLVRAYAATPQLRETGATLLLPIAGAALVDTLLRLTAGRMLLLLSDKGYSYLSGVEGTPSRHAGPVRLDAVPQGELKEEVPRPAGPGEPHLSLHGSFSLPVNMHAVRHIVHAFGGRVMGTTALEGYKVVAGLFGDMDPRAPVPVPVRAGEGVCASPPCSCRVSVTCPLPRQAGVPPSPPLATMAIADFLVAQGLGVGVDGVEAPVLPFMPAQAGTLLPSYTLRGKGRAAHAAPCCDRGGCGAGGGECTAPALAGFDLAQDALELDPHLTSSSSSSSSWSCTQYALSQSLHGFTPDDFSTLQRGVKEETGGAGGQGGTGPSLRHALAILRLACHDPDVFLKVKGAIIEQGAVGGAHSSAALATDIQADVDRVYSAHYALQISRDVCFELGRVLMGHREHAAAVNYFRDSNEHCGAHHVTWHNQGLCYYHLGDLPAALSCFDAALALKGEYGEARVWRDRVAGRLATSDGHEGVGERGITSQGRGGSEDEEAGGSVGAGAGAVTHRPVPTDEEESDEDGGDRAI